MTYNTASTIPRQVTSLLHGVRVVLCIGGSIAAYKACDLVRALRQEGAQVTAVLSSNAIRFVTPLTLQALTGRPVFVDHLDDNGDDGMAHIALAREADVVVLAPASAQQLAELAHGMASDLIGCIFLAASIPRVIAPAMNMHMWQHPATQANCARLADYGYSFVQPVHGEQACGDVGVGKLAPITTIMHALVSSIQPNPLAGKKILITAGGTREWFDPVRYLSNASSGKTGIAFARACQYLGADVMVVVANVTATLDGLDCVHVTTAEQMHDAVLACIDRCDMFIAIAAVADFKPTDEQAHKIKKHTTSDGWQVTYAQNPDILATVSQQVAKTGAACKVIGFAAETDAVLERGRDKLRAKKLDAIVINSVGKDTTFGHDASLLSVCYAASDAVYEYAGNKKHTALVVMQDIAHILYS